MSLHACNYCLYQYYLKAHGDKVTTKPKDGGVDVFVDGKWVCWFMELPDHCCC